jgi:hypothetical protein
MVFRSEYVWASKIAPPLQNSTILMVIAIRLPERVTLAEDCETILNLDMLHSFREAKENAVKNLEMMLQVIQLEPDQSEMAERKRLVKFWDDVPVKNIESSSLQTLVSKQYGSKEEAAATPTNISADMQFSNLCLGISSPAIHRENPKETIVQKKYMHDHFQLM